MKVGSIGAGTMGSGIAQAFAQTEGYEVFLCDINEEFAANGKKKIAKGFEKRIAKGKMTQEAADAVLAKITTGVKTICTDCDLVVEAALENMQIKKQTFKELQDICKADCIFATNTSSLSITEIGAGLDRPVIGMHFFNPAPVMKLVEVIAGLNTPEEVVEKIKAISVEIGKTPVQVNEAAGFVVNRILVPMINEGICVLEAGVASVEDIDAAMKLGAKGYVLKTMASAQLIYAMDEVAAGKIYLPTALTSRFFEYFQRSFKEEAASAEENLLTYLTAREEEVLDLLTQGNNYKGIAAKLFISETTVKTHVNNIFQKLQVNDRTQAVLYALNNGFANRRRAKMAV